MKCRQHLPKWVIEQAEAWALKRAYEHIDENELDLIRRTYKIAMVSLHDKSLGGFGGKRLVRFLELISKKTSEMDDDFTGWKRIDDEIINDIGIDMEREDYDKIEAEWKRKHSKDKYVGSMKEED